MPRTCWGCYLAWRERPFSAPLDGTEPLRHALARAEAATADALDAAARPVLVAHQGILRLVMIALGELSEEDYFDMLIPEAQPIAVEVRAPPART
jgi:broad specificity phosphatase PhoE